MASFALAPRFLVSPFVYPHDDVARLQKRTHPRKLGLLPFQPRILAFVVFKHRYPLLWITGQPYGHALVGTPCEPVADGVEVRLVGERGTYRIIDIVLGGVFGRAFNRSPADEIVNKFAASKEYKLIESFAYDIFTEIKALPKVGWVRVYVEKPAAMDGCDATAFELQG